MVTRFYTLFLFIGCSLSSLMACAAFEQMVGVPTPTTEVIYITEVVSPHTPTPEVSATLAPTQTASLGIPSAAIQRKLSVTEIGPHLVVNLYGVASASDSGTINIHTIEIFEASTGLRLQNFSGLNIKTPLNTGVEIEDMNFDGYLDFRVVTELPTDTNTSYAYWFYAPNENLFSQRPELEFLVSPYFDAQTQRVTSFNRISTTESSTAVYEWSTPATLSLLFRDHTTTTDTRTITRWLPFTATAMGLTFEHPETWQIQEVDSGYRLTTDTAHKVQITRIEKSPDVSIQNFIATNGLSGIPVAVLQQELSTTLPRYRTIDIAETNTVLFDANNALYVFSLTPYNASQPFPDQMQIERLFEELLYSMRVAD